jgi:molecular chaperone HtpG
MDDKTIIGKDVIESLTTSMYDDPRFVYREYIQNSADAIDKARQIGLVADGNIYISINPEKRRIEIEDDAIGIEKDKVIHILKNIAQSTKQKGVDKGFRGIGRLGGLGYCDKLIFETSSRGENVKSIMIWDAKKLKKIIADRSHKEEASTVIDEVTSFKQENEIADKHYFKVILEGVTNEKLMNVRDVRLYLSMVAPVPFKKSIFSDKIYNELKQESIKIDEYNTYINEEQLFKGYKWYVYEGDENNPKKVDEVIDICFFKDVDDTKKILFWGWYGITEKNQSLNKINFARGFRLRKENIQIGEDSTLDRFHSEKRFQNYFFGEVHAIHSELYPNARRDFFSENDTCAKFENKLKTFFYTTISKLCRISSDANSATKDILNYNTKQIEFQNKEKEGFTSNDEKSKLEKELENSKEKAEKATLKLEKLQEKENPVSIQKILTKANEKLEAKIQPIPTEKEFIVEKPKFRTDKLSKLNKNDRKFLGEIFTIIGNVLTKDLAENLIQKIEEKYK